MLGPVKLKFKLNSQEEGGKCHGRTAVTTEKNEKLVHHQRDPTESKELVKSKQPHFLTLQKG